MLTRRLVARFLMLWGVLGPCATAFGETVVAGFATLDVSDAGTRFSYGPDTIIVDDDYYLAAPSWKRISDRTVQYETTRAGNVLTRRTKKNPLLNAEIVYTVQEQGLKIDVSAEILPNSGARFAVMDVYLGKPTFTMAGVQSKDAPPAVLDPKTWKTMNADRLLLATEAGQWAFALTADNAQPWNLRSVHHVTYFPPEKQTFEFVHMSRGVPAEGMKEKLSFEARFNPNRAYQAKVEQSFTGKCYAHLKALEASYKGTLPAASNAGKRPLPKSTPGQVNTVAKKVCEMSADLDQSRIPSRMATVIPEPKSYKKGTGVLQVPQVLEVSCSAEHEAALEVLSLDLARHGVTLRPVASGGSAPFVMGVPASDAIVAEACPALGVTLDAKNPGPSGYKLVVTPQKMLLAANDAAGVLYGAQTLRQLIRPGADGAEIPAVNIADWPDLKFRGFFISRAMGFPGDQDLRRLIRETVSYFKANVLFLEIMWPDFRWRSRPEVAGPDARPVEELAALAAHARRYHLQLLPAVRAYGKADDLFRSHPEIAEDLDWQKKGQSHGAYCPSRPETYALIFDIMQEIVEATQCRAMNIGHDEIEGIAVCPVCSKIPPADLFANEVNKIADWLAERNVMTMLWGDMLLEKERWKDVPNVGGHSGDPVYGGHVLHPALEKMRKDVIIGDWHYSNVPSVPTLKHFADSGFRVVGCTWFRRENNYYMAQEIKRVGQRGLGVLVTDWATSLTHCPCALSMLGVVYAWNTAMPEPSRLKWSPEAALAASTLDKNKPSRIRGATFKPISLEAVANRALSGDETAWFGLGTWHDLAYLPTGNLRLFGVDYCVAKQCVVVSSATTDRQFSAQSAPVPVGGKAKSLVFLHALCVPSPEVTRRTFGQYRVTYAGGQMEDVAIDSRNATHWLSEAPRKTPWRPWGYNYTWDATLAWEGCTRSGEVVNLQAYEWVNPRPDDQIVSIELVAAPEKAVASVQIALVALTAVQ